MVPIYDTSLAACKSDPFGRVLAVSTAFGDIREYDVRANKRATCSNQIVKTSQMLSNLLQSELNEHQLYVITQEGHPVVVDRRFNHRVVKKMPGSRGSIRTASLLTQNGVEFLITGGCDRHLRIYDASKDL